MDKQKHMETAKHSISNRINNYCKVGFWFGVASVFLGWIGIIPLIGMTISIVGLVKFNKSSEKGLWMGITGFILNLLYSVANAYANGNIG